MKRIIHAFKHIAAAVSVAMSGTSAAAGLAFYYGHDVPVTAASKYQSVVLQPNHADAGKIADLRNQNISPLAYISISEVFQQEGQNTISEDWVIGGNSDWSTVIWDIRKPEVRQFILQTLVDVHWTQGFRGFFLDTTDSHLRTEVGQREPEQFNLALVTIVKEIKQRYPESRIYMNRGFDVAAELAPYIHGVAFESLYSAFLVQNHRYQQVPGQDRAWLLGKTLPLKEYGLDIIAIDYLPKDRWDEVPELIKKIEQHGFSAWVSDGLLAEFGIGSTGSIK